MMTYNLLLGHLGLAMLGSASFGFTLCCLFTGYLSGYVVGGLGVASCVLGGSIALRYGYRLADAIKSEGRGDD